MSTSRNVSCSCGSGKKFKHCCRRNSFAGGVPQPWPIPSDGVFLRRLEPLHGTPHQPKPITRIGVNYVIEDRLGKTEVGYCYPIGIRVIMEDGNLLPVECLKEGMRFRLEDGGVATVTDVEDPKVWEPPSQHRDENGNSSRRVIGTAKYKGYFQRLDVGVPGDILKTTPGHLFWSENRQAWVPAGTFQPGELLRNRQGLPVPVEWLSPIRFEFCELYNIEVEELHTYFVGGSSHGGIWAHNGLGTVCRVPRAAVAKENGMRVVTARQAGIVKSPDHHIFPQQFRDWFAARGVNIDRYLVRLDQSIHEAIHYKLPGETGGGFWNNQIINRLMAREADLGRQLTTREILLIGAQMRRQYLSGFKVLPFGG